MRVLLSDSAFISQYGFNLETIRTMFIPNTYEVYWAITPQNLMERMYQEYQRFWSRQRLQKAKVLALTPTEVSILASIVQEETTKMDEAPAIAGVYINRLRKGMRLQACPTLKYAARNFHIRRVLKKYQEIDSPYNTYKYKGLPPGPINIPSIAAIDAVLNLEEHDYLYFAAKKDFSGYHSFTTFEAHMRNAKGYRQTLNKAGVYR